MQRQENMATPQQIGDVISAYAAEADDNNPEDPGFIERIAKRPEGALLLLMVVSLGAGILSSAPAQDLLRRIAGGQ